MEFRSTIIKKQDVERIHEATLKILEDVGVDFLYDEVLEVFKKHGAKVEGHRVFISEALLNQALKTVPTSFVWKGPKSEVTIGGERTVVAPLSGVIEVSEKGEKRRVNSEDFIKLTKLHESSKVMDVHNPNIMVPLDIPEDKQRNYALATTLKLGTKPVIGFTTTKKDAVDSLYILKKFHETEDDCVALGIISTLSPLAYDKVMLESLFEFAKEKQPLMFATCSLPGATSPVTIAGTLATNNAEQLAGIVLSQLVCPGLPVIYGNTTGSCDMRYATPAIGAAETALITYATAALAQYYGVPSRSGGSLADSKIPDIQAGIEGSFTLIPPFISGIHMVLHSCGILDSFNLLSYEKYIIDEHLVAMCKRLAEGINVNDETLAVDLIKQVGPKGQYLEEMHTTMYYRKEHCTSKLFVKEGLEVWEKKGAKSAVDRAYEEMQKRLSKYKAPELTKEQEEFLKPYLTV